MSLRDCKGCAERRAKLNAMLQGMASAFRATYNVALPPQPQKDEPVKPSPESESKNGK
jgi:hypothetical protein